MKRGGRLKTRKPLRRGNRNDTPTQTRADVVARDIVCRARPLWDHTCVGGLHVHHILPRGRGGRHEMDNLIAVCRAAHAWIHEHPTQARTLGLLS